MNRRVVLPASIVGLALCLAIIALPVSGPVSASRPQATQAATVDPCNPEPAVAGLVLDNLYVLDFPDNAGLHLIKVFKTDVVEVLGKSSSGFWLVIRTNSGIVGWAPSPQIFVDKKQWANPTTVPVLPNELPKPEAAAEGTAAATEAAADANGNCPVVDSIITADAFQLQVGPLTNSGNVGTRITKGAHVVILALNASG